MTEFLIITNSSVIKYGLLPGTFKLLGHTKKLLECFSLPHLAQGIIPRFVCYLPVSTFRSAQGGT